MARRSDDDNERYEERVVVPVTKEMKQSFLESVYWERDNMSEVVRGFIEKYIIINREQVEKEKNRSAKDAQSA